MASQHQLSIDGAAVAPRTPAKIAEWAQIIAFLLPSATPPVIAMCCGGDGEVAARLVGRLGSSQIARFAVLQRGKKSPWRALLLYRHRLDHLLHGERGAAGSSPGVDQGITNTTDRAGEHPC
jgi:hypothetical protein